jgi:N-acetylmuramoyl-L-alanine amidase
MGHFVWDSSMGQRMVVLGTLVLTLLLAPATSVAQECADCVVSAATELNLRQDPSMEAPILGLVPAGSSLQQAAGDETNGYVPVSYDGVSGWVIAEGLVASSEEVGVGAASAAPSAATSTSADARVTVAPLLLRSGPSTDAEPILEMPEGAVVTLTRDGAENGYVTVEFDGIIGWAYAELLSEPTSGE